jgi:O-antigen/teichoic acid export membrane protein
LLYTAAPAIASFYQQPILTDLARAIGLTFIINAFSLVQNVKLSKDLDFKTQLKIRIPSILAGGVGGLAFAYFGFGVWSLVYQQIIISFLSALQFWIKTKWRPDFVFDLIRVKELFSFGGKMMISGIIDTLFRNLYLIIIGKFFSPADVGYFNRANTTKQLPVTFLGSALEKVTFPVFASIQNDNDRLKRAYKKLLKQVLFWILPVLTLAAVLAEPLFRLVFTEKWIPAVPYFQWLCIVGFMYPISAYNLNILRVKGRSDLFLKLEIIKKIIVLVGILVSFQFGIMGLIYAQVIISFVAYGINSFYSGYFINYGIAEQLKDILPTFAATFVMGLAVYWLVDWLEMTDLLIVITAGFFGIGVYYIFSSLLKLDALLDFKEILLEKF